MMLDVSTRLVTLDRALSNEQLLGLGDPSWLTWRSVLKAAYAEPLSVAEREAFVRVAGNRLPPARKVKELVVAASRRSGKGRAAGGLATYESALVDHSARLAPGEVGVVACISPTREQAKIVQRYALGYFETSPVLRDEIADVTADEIRLRNGNVICTLANDYRTLRGRTLLLAILDEASFLRDESSTTPDIEAARALLPGLSTARGMLCILSSPYRRVGLLYQRYRDFFAKDGDGVLCVAGCSLAFNPTLDQAEIAAAREADPQAALSEWDGEFRSDLLQFLDDASIDGAVDASRPAELPTPRAICHAFTDMAAGGPDASTIAVCYRDGERIICAALRGRHGNPQAAVEEFAALAKSYRCRTITGDNFAKDWVANAYRSCGLEYRRSPLTRSDLYLEGRIHFARNLINIPNNPVLVRELRFLERRVSKTGRDQVSHPAAGGTHHDDHANSLFGAMYLCAKAAQRTKSKIVSPSVFSNGSWWGAPPAPTQRQPSTTELLYQNGYGGSRWPGSDRFSNDW
jgi:hypothetical protein